LNGLDHRCAQGLSRVEKMTQASLTGLGWCAEAILFKSAKTRTMVTAIALLGLTACSGGYQVRGYIFDGEIANNILVGVDNRTSVQASMGNPTLPSSFDENTWYYISTEVRTRPVFWPSPIAHRAMAVKFADNGTVTEVKNYYLSDTRRVYPVDDKTPTYGRNTNFFLQLFSGVGQFGGAPGQGQNPNQQGPSRPNG